MYERIAGWWRLRSLISYWSEFRELVLQCEGSAEVTPLQEATFLRLKAKIASRLSHLSTGVPSSVAQEAHRHQALMTDLLNRHHTLKVVVPRTDQQKEDFDRAWHQHFIFLNSLRGMHPEPAARKAGSAGARRRLPAVPTGMPTGRVYHQRSYSTARFARGFLRLVVQLGILVAILYLLARAFGVRWEAGHFTASKPAGASGFGHNLAGGIQSILDFFTGFMQPVVASYGLYVTLGLVGVLLLGLGYLFLVRER
jgi:hypothetical protein